LAVNKLGFNIRKKKEIIKLGFFSLIYTFPKDIVGHVPSLLPRSRKQCLKTNIETLGNNQTPYTEEENDMKCRTREANFDPMLHWYLFPWVKRRRDKLVCRRFLSPRL
jgi:hypothetical protein